MTAKEKKIKEEKDKYESSIKEAYEIITKNYEERKREYETTIEDLNKRIRLLEENLKENQKYPNATDDIVAANQLTLPENFNNTFPETMPNIKPLMQSFKPYSFKFNLNDDKNFKNRYIKNQKNNFFFKKM